MSEESFDIVIVGAGHAGAHAAIALRQLGYEGSLAIVGDEPSLPYERPPLTKEYLAGDKPFERMLLRPEKFWGERDIVLRQGRRVAAVDVDMKFVTLSNDAMIGYDKLIWAAGGSPRMLACPGAQARNVFAVRRLSDVDALRALLPSAERIAIVGGGYIGLEAAAVLNTLGKHITIVESQDRVLSRVAGVGLSRFYENCHADRGVEFVLGSKVDRIETDNEGRATALILDNGDTLATDMVIVGIGIVPETGPLLLKGAAGGNGVDVDEFCRTSLPDIYAIGDCAAHANPYANGAHIRLESVQNANDQAKTAASHIVGTPVAYDAIPWFWSNQYDLKLQTVGLSMDYDTEILRGDPEARSFSVAYLRDGKLIALDCVNKTKDYVQGRKAIAEGAVLDPDELSGDVPINEVSRL